MTNTECDRIKCVHNKMCNYLFELFNAQFTNVIDCDSYEEERPQGDLNLEYLAKFADKTPSYETVKQLGFAGSYEDYLKTICGADMRGGKQ